MFALFLFDAHTHTHSHIHTPRTHTPHARPHPHPKPTTRPSCTQSLNMSAVPGAHVESKQKGIVVGAAQLCCCLCCRSVQQTSSPFGFRLKGHRPIPCTFTCIYYNASCDVGIGSVAGSVSGLQGGFLVCSLVHLALVRFRQAAKV